MKIFHCENNPLYCSKSSLYIVLGKILGKNIILLFSCPYSNLDFQWLNELFNHLVAALQRTLVHCLDDPSEFTGKSTFSTQDLSDMCSAASSIASHSCLKDFWRQTQHHLLTAQKELCLLAEVLKANAPSTALSESSLQSSMQIVKIHLGVALSLMLCPTEVDPLMMKKVKNQCFEKIVSHMVISIIHFSNEVIIL